MLQNFKKLLRFFMSDEPPNIYCLLSSIRMPSIGLTASWVVIFPTTSSCFLEKLEHRKADRPPKHEFLKGYFTLYLNGKAYKMAMIVDRRPAENIDIEAKDASAQSPIVSPHPLSLSPSPSAERLQAALGKGGKSIIADDRVTIPRFGLREDLDGLATKEFGSYVTLNTLTIRNKRTNEHTMSAPQFARLVEIAHEIAPIYDLKEHNCYWFAHLIFFVVKKRTGGAEIGGDKIEQQGKLWYYKLGGHSGHEGGVPNHEYERALKDLQVSNYRDLVV